MLLDQNLTYTMCNINVIEKEKQIYHNIWKQLVLLSANINLPWNLIQYWVPV